ncbi:unnamed protein product [Linum trigynum]|uniref:Uncharacterized protein n=1 Tax=Linum trigynum TaxID=586398 RepID=A0AAV2CUV5_9ROSI
MSATTKPSRLIMIIIKIIPATMLLSSSTSCHIPPPLPSPFPTLPPSPPQITPNPPPELTMHAALIWNPSSGEEKLESIDFSSSIGFAFFFLYSRSKFELELGREDEIVPRRDRREPTHGCIDR